MAKGSIADIHRFGGTVTAKDSVAVLPDTNGKVAEVEINHKEITGLKIHHRLIGSDSIVTPVSPDVEGDF